MSGVQAVCIIRWKQKCTEGEGCRETAVPGVRVLAKQGLPVPQ